MPRSKHRRFLGLARREALNGSWLQFFFHAINLLLRLARHHRALDALQTKQDGLDQLGAHGRLQLRLERT